MSIVDSGVDFRELQEGLGKLSAPYLLRKYDATAEDYERLAHEDLRCEYVDGVLVVHSPASLGHEERIWFLDVVIGNFVAARRLGRVFGSNAVMQLGERRLCPDVSFLKTEHGDRVQGERVVGPMDLVVEILSRSTRDYDLGEKRELYRAGGVPEIWMFDPERREAHTDMAEPGGYATRTLASGRIVSRVLDGLEIEPSWLWSDPLPNPLECHSRKV